MTPDREQPANEDIPAPHPHVELLRSLYADLDRIADHCTEDVVLHPADRRQPDVLGPQAVRDHERALVRATGETLVMDVEHIAATDHFAAVLGTLRAEAGKRGIAMPFCGLWRFRNGRIVEHWENAYNPVALAGLLGGPPAPTGP